MPLHAEQAALHERELRRLSIRADEAEESWRVVTPVLEGWSRGLAPLEEYDAGSSGPPARAQGA